MGHISDYLLICYYLPYPKSDVQLMEDYVLSPTQMVVIVSLVQLFFNYLDESDLWTSFCPVSLV